MGAEAFQPTANSDMVIMSGISGSGKSTRARELARKEGHVRVSRDEIRQMVYGYTDDNVNEYYNQEGGFKHLEDKISSIESFIILQAWEEQKPVVVDNTNLDFEYLVPFIERYKDFFNIKIYLVPEEVETCIERDSKRTRSVGAEIIRKQQEQFAFLAKNLDQLPI